MNVRIDGFTRLDGKKTRPASGFSGRRVHAVAGIGDPGGFFAMLGGLGIDVESRPFPDHYRYVLGDFDAMRDAPIVMTEKDAVKCTEMPLENAWFAHATADLDERFDENLTELLKP